MSKRMRRMLLTLAGLGLAASLHAEPAPGCPPWPQAEKNLRVRGYDITKLSPTGVQRTVDHLSAKTAGRPNSPVPGDWVGYFAKTTFLFAVANGQRANVGGVPVDRAMIVLTDKQGECLAQVGGTIQQMEAVLDGSSKQLSDAFAR